MTQTPDVIIIGAGPAGLSAAKILADSGIKTIVLERGIKSGSKNFFSGIINKKTVEEVFGKISDDMSEMFYAPIERKLTEYRAYLLNKDSFIALNEGQTLNNRFVVLHQSFNDWMCKQAQNAGATIVFETIAEELIVDNSKICGVKTSKGDFFSDVVIIAEGTNSIITKKSGLRKGEIPQEQVFLFVEEALNLQPELIQERFNLNKNNGTSIRLFTEELISIPSTGYIHTNKHSITLGIGILFSETIPKGINVNNCLELVKKHPAILPLIKKSTSIHYSSFILPCHVEEKQFFSTVKPCENGCLIIGGASLAIDPFSWDISSNAILSGKLASEAIIRAKDLNDYTKKTLAEYENLIKKNLTISPYRHMGTETINNLERFLLQG